MNTVVRKLTLTLILVVAVSSSAKAGEQKTQVHRLENGLTVLLRPVDGAQQVALVVLYSLGGDHDPAGRSGLAHLIEHLYVTAAAGATRARSIREYMRRYPAGWNAQTGDRYTVVATMFAREALETELQDAADRMGDLRIDASDLDREKPRIFAELSNMFARMPALAARNLARERVRPTPADGRKGGVPEHVRAITLDEVRSRWQRYYKPTNAILALAGGFDPEAARSVIERHFADLPPGAPAPPAQSPGRPRLGPPEQVSVRAVQPTAPAQACLAFPAPAPGSKEYAPFLVLVGRMWRAAGPQAGAGQITVYYTPIDDPSWVGVASSLRTGETTEEAVARLESFISVATEPELDPSEILMTKNTFGFFLRTADIPDSVLTQNPYSVAFSLARRTQLGLDPQKLTKAIDSVRAPDLRRVAKTIFAQDRRAAVVVIPEAQKGREEN